MKRKKPGLFSTKRRKISSPEEKEPPLLNNKIRPLNPPQELKISPAFRLSKAIEATKYGTREISDKIGVSQSTVRRWMTAYRTVGEYAHIFQEQPKNGGSANTTMNNKNSMNTSRKNYFYKYSEEEKQEILDQVEVFGKNMLQVAFECGLGSNTIAQWRRAFKEEKEIKEEEDLSAEMKRNEEMRATRGSLENVEGEHVEYNAEKNLEGNTGAGGKDQMEEKILDDIRTSIRDIIKRDCEQDGSNPVEVEILI